MKDPREEPSQYRQYNGCQAQTSSSKTATGLMDAEPRLDAQKHTCQSGKQGETEKTQETQDKCCYRESGGSNGYALSLHGLPLRVRLGSGYHHALMALEVSVDYGVLELGCLADQVHDCGGLLVADLKHQGSV